MSKAFIFDMNGTMIDDMHYHTEAWGHIINHDLKGNLSPEQLKREMYGKNEELLERVFGKGAFSKEEMNRISLIKEDRYQEAFKPHLHLIKGLDIFLEHAYKQGIPMGIGTAAIPYNIDFILDNLHLRHYFPSIVSAIDVAESKPHPETFLKVAAALHVPANDCIVFEDAPKGVEAAQNAGMKVVVVTTMHNEKDFKLYNNVLFYIKDYTDQQLVRLLGF